MSFEHLFSAAGTLALVGWLALAGTPLRHAWPRRIAIAIAMAVAVLYSALVAVHWSGREGGFGSLADVARLFEHRGLLLAGWVHYLAFDLLVGAWERKEARRIGLSWWALAPCLALTFLFGPLGWLVFLAVRQFRLQTLPRADAA